MKYLFILFLLLIMLSSCGRPTAGTEPVTLDELTIEVYDTSRELGYTNKEAGFYCTESNNEQSSGWQGWHVMSKKILDDYAIAVDGKDLRRVDVQFALVDPHQCTRSYTIGVQETVTFLDSVNALVVELRKVKGSAVTIRPLFTESQDSGDYVVTHKGSSAFVAKKNHTLRTRQEDYPVWIGISIIGSESRAVSAPYVRDHRFAPVFVEANAADGNAVAILVAGDTMEETESLLEDVIRNYKPMIASRKTRMEEILRRAFVRTDNERFDKALHWAILSMDALVMNQGKKGIFAGLPWFSSYWGRDSFISLPGATLVTGNFSDAKAILRSFAEWQQKDQKSPMQGRIPNLVTPTSISYNTTDGTPWFVIALGDYVTASGDTAFAREMFPVVKRSIEGPIKHRVDGNLFLVHEDAETWMDAVGPDGPWSPRGNRANDIQALWYKQLLVASWMADMAGDTKSLAQWVAAAETVRRSFNRDFVDPDSTRVYDHLNPNETPDHQTRPNQIFTLDLIDDQEKQFNAFKKVTESLVYSHGVGSLSQDDENFHPFHHYAPLYVQDAAYHNGIVWTWLAGPWISAATRFGYTELAHQLTDNMVHQILDRGAVGTLSELLDAAPRDGEREPRLSGTFSQAWSLAEFIRNLYQDYLGVAVDATQNKIELHPHLPPSIKHVRFNIPIGNQLVAASYESSQSGGIITLASPASAPQMEALVTWQLGESMTFDFACTIPSGSNTTIDVTGEGVTVRDSSGERPIQMNILRSVGMREPLQLAVPTVRADLKALKPPSHRILTNEEIKVPAASAQGLFEAADPQGDDRGTGSYSYPSNPNFKSGILDITGFKVSSDEKNVFFSLSFRSLSNPGWHPEYGFQLTFAAIAIDTDGNVGSGQTTIGRNAAFTLLRKHAYESIIFVGGGIRLEDARGNILAEYQPVPGDERNPLGSAANKSVSFSIPMELIGRPQSSWNYTVLVGAQDDHGGAGIGDFRSVQAVRGEWTGGGKRRSSGPNVYDVILPKR